MDKIAVLIPCYNESKTIEKVVKDFKKVLPEAVIYVYDNNSTDHTDEIARAAGAVVRYEYQQGKGNVIRRGSHPGSSPRSHLLSYDGQGKRHRSQQLHNGLGM